MNTKPFFSVVEPLPRHESRRQVASQARSDFLADAFAGIWRSIRDVVESRIGAFAQNASRAARDA